MLLVGVIFRYCLCTLKLSDFKLVLICMLVSALELFFCDDVVHFQLHFLHPIYNVFSLLRNSNTVNICGISVDIVFTPNPHYVVYFCFKGLVRAPYGWLWILCLCKWYLRGCSEQMWQFVTGIGKQVFSVRSVCVCVCTYFITGISKVRKSLCVPQRILLLQTWFLNLFL